VQDTRSRYWSVCWARLIHTKTGFEIIKQHRPILAFPNLLRNRVEIAARYLLLQKYAGQVIPYVLICLLCLIGKKNNRIAKAFTLPTALSYVETPATEHCTGHKYSTTYI